MKAVVVLKAGTRATEQELITHCKTRIASYKCPKSVEYMDEIPRLPSGKVTKVTLRERFGPQAK